jgi:hypothetical protein
MPAITRRDLMRKSSLAASATLVSAGLAGASAQESPGGNVFHVFAFQWKPGATDELKATPSAESCVSKTRQPWMLMSSTHRTRRCWFGWCR